MVVRRIGALVVAAALVLSSAMPAPAALAEEWMSAEGIQTEDLVYESGIAASEELPSETSLVVNAADDGQAVLDLGPTDDDSYDEEAESLNGTVAEGAAGEADRAVEDGILMSAEPAEADSITALSTPSVRYRGHVQSIGWQDYVTDGESAGTFGQSLRVEALRIRLANLPDGSESGIRYRMHVQSIGWQDWVSDGALAGTTGRALRVEALQVELTGDIARRYDVYYRVHAQTYGWMGWAKNGKSAGTAGHAKRLEAIQVVLVPKGGMAPKSTDTATEEAFVGGKGIAVAPHVQSIGWMSAVGNGEVAGTTGRSLRVEALKVALDGLDVPGDVEVQAHVQHIGWQDWVAGGQLAGTVGKGLRAEAFRMRLTGEAAQKYDLYYRVHTQSIGWMGWAKNGEAAGTQGMSRRLEAVQVYLVKKGDQAPIGDGATTHAFVSAPILSFAIRTTAKQANWSGNKASGEVGGNLSGTSVLRGFRARLTPTNGSLADGGISYEATLSDGESVSASDGEAIGVEGASLSALRISLTGETSKFFDVYYRAYTAPYGWLGWAHNGELAGTSGLDAPIKALELQLVRTGATPVYNDDTSTYFGSFLDKNALGTLGQLVADANARQKAMVKAAKSTPTTPAGMCAAWITNVASNAGIGYFGGDARDMYRWYCTSSKLSDLKVGMIVAVSSHPNTYLGSIYGHVGIYVGDGIVMDSAGRVRKMPLEEWMDFYGGSVPVKWGWFGGVALA